MRYELAQANRLGNRDSNEDRFAWFQNRGTVLLALADGLGGHEGGDLAAELFIEKAREAFTAGALSAQDPERFFRRVVERAHRAIVECGRERRPSIRPGTTGALCLVAEGQATWAHVGDSRVYLFRNGLPICRTEDHSYVGRLYQQGIIGRQARDSHPLRGRITQCIGCHEEPPRVAVGKTTQLYAGDVILLCSDGLWSAIDDACIGAQLESGRLDEAVQRLAADAETSAYPNSDNISVLALRMLQPDGSKEGADTSSRKGAGRNGPAPEGDRLQEAIDRIEQVIQEYEDEMTGD